MRSLAVLALMFATMSSSFTGTHLNTSALENNVSTQNVQSEDSVSVESYEEEGNLSEDSDNVEDFTEAPAESEDEMEDQEDSSDVENDEDDGDDEDYIEPSLEEKYEANMNFDTTNEWWDVPSCEDGDHVWYEMVDENDAPIKVCKRCGQSCEE